MVETATVCRCEDGRSFFNCTTDDTQEEVRIFRTTGTESCLSDGFDQSRRRKRSVSEQEVVDDDVILPDDIPIPPSTTTTEFPPSPTWPTASGITEQQARDTCVKVLENYAAYNICREYVDIELVVEPCALNIQVCLHIGLLGVKCNEKCTEMASVSDDAIHEVRRGLQPTSATPRVDWPEDHACGCSGKNRGDGDERWK